MCGIVYANINRIDFCLIAVHYLKLTMSCQPMPFFTNPCHAILTSSDLDEFFFPCVSITDTATIAFAFGGDNGQFTYNPLPGFAGVYINTKKFCV